jgi:ADP-heptose:LPS heptosyltransferase
LPITLLRIVYFVWHPKKRFLECVIIMLSDQRITLKRLHGLGNVICLLPVADRLCQQGYTVSIITRREWAGDLAVIRHNYLWNEELSNSQFVDLDVLTADRPPREHRTDEFGRLLGLEPPFASLKLEIPESWQQPFESLRDCVIFAPEGGHPSRQWPERYAANLAYHLPNRWIVAVGTDPNPEIVCDEDLRGTLKLRDLMGVLSVAGAVITMDSAVLHIAAALGVPTVAIFGGVNPEFRIRPDQRVVAIQSDLPCCPCNKNESCDARYPCIAAARPEDVALAVSLAFKVENRTIYRVKSPVLHSYAEMASQSI